MEPPRLARGRKPLPQSTWERHFGSGPPERRFDDSLLLEMAGDIGEMQEHVRRVDAKLGRLLTPMPAPDKQAGPASVGSGTLADEDEWHG
jgi:hypothetical protein